MNELRNKVFKLVNSLDKDERIIKVRNVNKRILDDKEFCLLIDKYKSTYGNGVKVLIEDHPLYLEYLDSEREVNLLIGEINSKLGCIYKKNDCSKCGGCSESN